MHLKIQWEENMTIKTQMAAVLAAGLLAGPTLALAQTDYDYQTIDYPGATGTQVFGINDRGDVSGNGFSDTGNFPFVYDTKKGTFTDVAPVAGFDSTSVLGISDSGVLVGSVFDGFLLKNSGLIIHKDGPATVFDHPDAVAFTQARAINNDGLVTGFRDDPSGFSFGFIYDPETNTFTDLNPTSWFTIAQGINSQGEVVGSSNFDFADDPCPGLGNPFLRYGWFRAEDGTVTYFEVNGSRTSARGISDEGSIVGFVTDLDDGKVKGFKVELDGSQCQSITVAASDLIEFPGAELNFLQGIKNSGTIAGSYRDDQDISHGFMATPQ
jgi:uncharacterized membrane protein